MTTVRCCWRSCSRQRHGMMCVYCMQVPELACPDPLTVLLHRIPLVPVNSEGATDRRCKLKRGDVAWAQCRLDTAQAALHRMSSGVRLFAFRWLLSLQALGTIVPLRCSGAD